jgi:hypothetical protein
MRDFRIPGGRRRRTSLTIQVFRHDNMTVPLIVLNEGV